eukprot:1320124-Amorphochlora_amoeboformis.AAC.2
MRLGKTSRFELKLERERRTWTNSVGTLVVAVVAGACFGLLIASVSGSVNLGIGAVTSTRSFPPAVVGPRQTPSSLVGFASRQQREAIERFKETGLRPGEKIKDPQEGTILPYSCWYRLVTLCVRWSDTRTGRSIVADPVSIDVKDFDGKVIGSEDLALKVTTHPTIRVIVTETQLPVGSSSGKCSWPSSSLPGQLPSNDSSLIPSVVPISNQCRPNK